MQHVVLFELEPLGHRMVFVRYIVEAMVRQGRMRATLVTLRRGVTPWVETARDRLSGHFSVCVVESEPHPVLRPWLPVKLARQFACSNLLRSVVGQLNEKEGVDHVFIPFLDDYSLFPFVWHKQPFGTTPWSGITIRPRFHLVREGAGPPPRREDWIEAWAYRRLLRDRSLGTLFSIDPCFPDAFADPRVAAICDPADITDLPYDRAWLPVLGDAVVVLVYGYIDQRKAIDRLLKVAADPRMPASLVVALVGAQDPGVAPVLHGPAAAVLRAKGRLVELARHVSDGEEASAFARADIVWSYYPSNYCSSGAMVRAGQMGRPLMTTDEGLAGALTRQYGSGLTAPEADDEMLFQQLRRMVAEPRLRIVLGEAGVRHFARATGTAFGDRIVDRIAGLSNE